MENGRCVSDPPLSDLRATYKVHLRLIGKYVLVVDFLLVSTELIC